jgi:serine/threonine protein kinase
MPPEQAFGEWGMVDARSDVFSAGATAEDLIVGKPPYEGRYVPAELPSAHDISNISPELADVLDKSLQYMPDDRFQSSEAMREALANVPEHVRTKMAALMFDKSPIGNEGWILLGVIGVGATAALLLSRK